MAEIVGLPYSGFAPSNDDIAKYLRDVADNIEQGEPIRNLYFITEFVDGQIEPTCIGQPSDMARMIGILNIANTKLILGLA